MGLTATDCFKDTSAIEDFCRFIPDGDAVRSNLEPDRPEWQVSLTEVSRVVNAEYKEGSSHETKPITGAADAGVAPGIQ